MSNQRARVDVDVGRIKKRLILQFLAALFLWPAVIVLVVLVGVVICKSITWYESNPLYWFLQFISFHLEFTVIITVFIGWVFIAVYFLAKPFSYVKELVDASEQLIGEPDKPISLSESMKNLQDRFNLFRERSNRNATAAKEAEQRKNDLVVYLAHDLKTPIASIIGYLTLLRDEKEISPTLHRHYVETVLDNAERLDDLINEFFEITCFNLSHITLEYRKLDLVRLLKQLTAEFHPLLTEKDLVCRLTCPNQLEIRCDGDKMERVFDNLLRNAVSYSVAGTEIQIKATVQQTCVILTFRNHGTTIPQEKLDRIFEQFYRLDSARSSKTGGSGLGLAIAKQIVELHHGMITAQSEQEEICFTVILPLGEIEEP